MAEVKQAEQVGMNVRLLQGLLEVLEVLGKVREGRFFVGGGRSSSRRVVLSLRKVITSGHVFFVMVRAPAASSQAAPSSCKPC